MKIIAIIFILISSVFANEATFEEKSAQVKEKIDNLDKAMYTPFVENFILNEIKALRIENKELKIQIHETLAKKEVEISNNVINYATSTINNMFYIIAAASALLVVVGWNSIREINEKVKNMIEEKTSKTINQYEKRLATFENDLKNRSRQVKQNQMEIERTNNVHSLWVRVSQETTINGKLEILDEILSIRPDDSEALTYKAETILEIGEAHWALSLTNQAISIDKDYANAYYQRAKAYTVLNQDNNAIEDLEKALSLNESYTDEIKNDEVLSKFSYITETKEV
jgi:tetratricopeptide (TPR) repeat protein